jgi:hypothetical protein
MTDMDEPLPQRNDLLVTGDSVYTLSYITLHGSDYHVQNIEGTEVAVVKSIDDTWRAVLNYYMDNPRWYEAWGGSHYFKFTRLGLLQVERKLNVLQDKSGKWVAYCNVDCLLGDDGEPAIFTSLEEAQCAAEKYLFDELARLLPSEDGRQTSTVAMQRR